MDVDLRVVAVKLTNRFRPQERENTSALLKYTWSKAEERRKRGQRAMGGAGGQEIAAKQAWRDIKG